MINCSASEPWVIIPKEDVYVMPTLYQLTQDSSAIPIYNSPQLLSNANLTYVCDTWNGTKNYWMLHQQFEPNPNSETDSVFQATSGFGFIFFNQTLLPSFLAEYAASILIFYATIVYIVASSFRSAFVPMSYTLFIENAVYCEDIIMIC